MTNHDPVAARELLLTRRRLFGLSAGAIGGLLGRASLGSLLSADTARGASLGADLTSGAGPLGNLGIGGPHFPAKAKRVIYMHMEGGPSQLDLFDYKPGLRSRFDQDLPNSIRDGQRLTGMTSGQARFPVAPSMFRFSRYPNSQDGAWISELLFYNPTEHTGDRLMASWFALSAARFDERRSEASVGVRVFG